MSTTMVLRERLRRVKILLFGHKRENSLPLPYRSDTYSGDPLSNGTNSFVVAPQAIAAHHGLEVETMGTTIFVNSPIQASPGARHCGSHREAWFSPIASLKGSKKTGDKPLPPLPHFDQDISNNIELDLDFRNTPNAILHGGVFPNAHNFTITTAHISDHNKTEEEIRAEEEKMARKVLEKLAAKGMPSAMLDSKERTYAPRCNENTRRTLRDRVVRWSKEDGESRRLLWLSGPAGVGKSAVAQTISEELKEEGLLGGVFFFSRPNDRSDPDVVIPTLVYQLSLLFPEYRDIVTRRLIKDPLILDRNRRTQFQTLVVDPICILITQHEINIQQPLLIVLDGLDECNDREAQLEFVEMISYYSRKERNLRLRWMICSRPEPDLKVAFASADCRAICVEEKLEVDDGEAQADAIRILEKGFAEIRNKYPDQLTQDWPGESKVRFIAKQSSGHLGFVSFIIRFIGDIHYDSPSSQLDVCLQFLEGTKNPEGLNPLQALDLLYTQILFNVPKNILHTAQRILGLFILYGNESLTALVHANFLGLDQATFYRALQRLHSVLLIPPAAEAASKPIQIYHASFADYLRDPARSGTFVLDEGATHFDVAIRGLSWLCYRRKKPSNQCNLPEPTWVPRKFGRTAVLESVCKFAFTPCWRAFPQAPRSCRVRLMEVLDNYDFDIQYLRWKNETRDFVYFIRWLFSSRPLDENIVFIDRWRAGRVDHCEKGEIAVWHRESDPDTFVASLRMPKHIQWNDRYSIHLRLGKQSNSACFWLAINSDYHPYFE